MPGGLSVAHCPSEAHHCAGQDPYKITKMNARVEQRPKRGMGCFGKGCLILIASGILLVVGGIGGTYWSLRHVYLSDKPAPIPEASAPTETTAATHRETIVATPSE